MCTNAVPELLIADVGYDAQHNHALLRDYLDIDSLFPAAIGRPTDKLSTDRWRWLMATDFDDETYGQRWQVETVMYMLKQNLGDALTARKYQTRRREMALICPSAAAFLTSARSFGHPVQRYTLYAMTRSDCIFGSAASAPPQPAAARIVVPVWDRNERRESEVDGESMANPGFGL